MQVLELVSIDGIRLEAAVHPAQGVAHGTVVQVHGITADMDEGGMFVRLADRLAGAGFAVARFSFRGHGGSGGTQRGVTIAGAMLDLEAALRYAVGRFGGPLTIVGASFGAVPVLLSLPWLGDRVSRLVLWNPVLDLPRTFLRPELAWGQENFGPAQQELLSSQGFLVVDGEFALGRVLFEECQHYRPAERFTASVAPALVLHGDRDTAVSYEIARQTAATRPDCDFHTVAGSDHGFDSRQREDEAIEVTLGWLNNQARNSP